MLRTFRIFKNFSRVHWPLSSDMISKFLKWFTRTPPNTRWTQLSKSKPHFWPQALTRLTGQYLSLSSSDIRSECIKINIMMASQYVSHRLASDVESSAVESDTSESQSDISRLSRGELVWKYWINHKFSAEFSKYSYIARQYAREIWPAESTGSLWRQVFSHWLRHSYQAHLPRIPVSQSREQLQKKVLLLRLTYKRQNPLGLNLGFHFCTQD